MNALTTASLAAVAVLGLCLFTSACAPRQPPGGDLWRAVKHFEDQR